jgi:hypothetical protein
VGESYSFTVSSPLRAPADRVWAHAGSFAGVNRELWPLARMTFPPAMSRLTPEAFPVGWLAFRSWILLFGLVPVEFDDITLEELEPGRGFSEVSRMLNVRQWRHRRSVTPAGEGCVVRDEVAFVPRWRWAGRPGLCPRAAPAAFLSPPAVRPRPALSRELLTRATLRGQPRGRPATPPAPLARVARRRPSNPRRRENRMARKPPPARPRVLVP